MAKQVFSLFLLASLAVLAASFPREGSLWRESFNRPTRADEVVVVPLEDREKESVEDSAEDDYGVGYPSPWSNSFGSFFHGMQAMLQQLRNQMQEVLSRMPQEPHGAANGTSLFFPSWDSLPGNTTSTTKVINGHVVTVNETTYKQGSDGSSAVFHIRVVDIKPKEPGTNIEGNSEEVETVEEALDSNSSPSSFENRRTSPQMLKWLTQLRKPSTPLVGKDDRTWFKRPVTTREFVPKSEEISDDMNSIDDSVEVFHKVDDSDRNSEHVIDLSRDTLVNQLMSDQQKKGGIVAIPADVELLDISNGKVLGEAEESDLQQRLPKPVVQRDFWEK